MIHPPTHHQTPSPLVVSLPPRHRRPSTQYKLGHRTSHAPNPIPSPFEGAIPGADTMKRSGGEGYSGDALYIEAHRITTRRTRASENRGDGLAQVHALPTALRSRTPHRTPPPCTSRSAQP